MGPAPVDDPAPYRPGPYDGLQDPIQALLLMAYRLRHSPESLELHLLDLEALRRSYGGPACETDGLEILAFMRKRLPAVYRDAVVGGPGLAEHPMRRKGDVKIKG